MHLSARARRVAGGVGVAGAVVVATATVTVVVRDPIVARSDPAEMGIHASGLEELAATALAGDPRRAALLARAAHGLQPSTSTALGMLDVALDANGVERVIPAHDGSVTAIGRTRRAIVSAGRDRVLRVWDPDSGALLAQRRLRAPIVRLGASRYTASQGAQIASADTRGRVVVWSLADPARP